MEHIKLDYYYGMESEQFAFFRIPKLLMTSSRYKDLSVHAKLLYGLMLDRMSLSRKNNWVDEDNKVYIQYSVEQVKEDLDCSKSTAIKYMTELKDIGLIKKERIGQGKVDIIYVMNFVTFEEEFQKSKNYTSENSGNNSDLDHMAGNIAEIQKCEEDICDEFQKSKNWTSKNQKSKKLTSRSAETKILEVQNLDINNNKINNIDYINNSNHIYPSVTGCDADEIDEMDEAERYMELIRENIEYDIMMADKHWIDRDMYEELYQIICDVVCVPRKTIRISGEDYPYSLVKSKFLKLKPSHLQYVIECIKNNTTKVSNIKAYMITALYNAQNTISHYYTAEVNHDFFGAR